MLNQFGLSIFSHDLFLFFFKIGTELVQLVGTEPF